MLGLMVMLELTEYVKREASTLIEAMFLHLLTKVSRCRIQFIHVLYRVNKESRRNLTKLIQLWEHQP